jgi:syntaxin 5
VANNKRIYDDRSAEVAELTFKVKKELTGLTQKIADLRLISQQRQDDGPVQSNRATEDHRNSVVGLLQTQLASISTKFTQVLQVSSSNIRAQRDRREQFGSTIVVPPPNPNLGFGASQRTVPKHRSGTASVGEDASHVAIEMPFQKMALTEHTDTSYLQSRNTALQGIEATINELGSIYQQLAHMISQQGEAVQRIDMNIESMQMNVQRGQEQLMRYLRSVSSNRWLMIKIFAVLIVFSVMFMFIFT